MILEDKAIAEERKRGNIVASYYLKRELPSMIVAGSPFSKGGQLKKSIKGREGRGWDGSF